MIAGATLKDLATDLHRVHNAKVDMLARTDKIAARALPMTLQDVEDESQGQPQRTRVVLDLLDQGQMAPTLLAHQQIGERVKIPKKYYDRMLREAPELLTRNINHWFGANPEQRMIRTLDGQVRAFLSNRYRPLDNFDLANAVLPTLTEMGCKIESCQLTDTRLYIQAIAHDVTAEITGDGKHTFYKGTEADIVKAGIIISNSEVGLGSLRVEPLIWRQVCSNGLVAPDSAMKKYHVGRGHGGGEDGQGVWKMLTDDTRKADDKAFWMKVRDVVKGSLNQDVFSALVDRMNAAASNGLPEGADPVKVIEKVGERLDLTSGEQGNVLRHLIEDGDLSQWGVVNAVTRTAEDCDSYDRAVEMERMGGSLLVLPKTDWEKLAAPSAN